ncbi:LOW QUALITY PROTEIN: Hypothetical protein PHPALM_8626 [Phytophthora palmivora]|uniref:Uncharacterized protein n=1 Tax=Phytophthora palmivora TaxID=4796 RepID=A0A2P4Y9C8_9STRA|nr:LOW QUALITY PROTEIN: Hypothetical protein PHPALM_8626 [Phytophthora palmivora]
MIGDVSGALRHIPIDSLSTYRGDSAGVGHQPSTHSQAQLSTPCTHIVTRWVAILWVTCGAVATRASKSTSVQSVSMPTCRIATKCKALGLLWGTKTSAVSIPAEKLAKASRRLHIIISSRFAPIFFRQSKAYATSLAAFRPLVLFYNVAKKPFQSVQNLHQLYERERLSKSTFEPESSRQNVQSTTLAKV